MMRNVREQGNASEEIQLDEPPASGFAGDEINIACHAATERHIACQFFLHLHRSPMDGGSIVFILQPGRKVSLNHFVDHPATQKGV